MQDYKCNIVEKTMSEYEELISADIVQMIHNKPFYGYILLGLRRVLNGNHPHVADVRARNTYIVLVINPKLLFAYPRKHRIAILEHEVNHVILKHILRGYMFSDKKKLNIAADMVVNSIIGKSELPENATFPDNYGLPSNETLEYYYNVIEIVGKVCDDCPIKDQLDEDKKRSNNTTSDVSLPDDLEDLESQKDEELNEKEENLDDLEEIEASLEDDDTEVPAEETLTNEEESQEDSRVKNSKVIIEVPSCHITVVDWGGGDIDEGIAEIKIDQLIQSAIKQAGSVPANIAHLIHYRKQAEVPWQILLRRFFGNANTNLVYTKKRVSKRYGTRPGIRITSRAKIALGIDSSGSIDSEILNMFCSEGTYAEKSQLADLWVVVFDADVQDVIHPFQNVTEVHGRGGTKFQPLINWAIENRCDAIVCLTDGHNFDLELTRPKIPVLWVITPDGRDVETFGENIHIHDIIPNG